MGSFGGIGFAPRTLWPTEVLTPSQITADQDDYDPGARTSSNPRNVLVYVDTDAARTITGLALTGGNVAGDTVTIRNDGSEPIDLSHDDASSEAANQLQLKGGNGLRLLGGDSVTLVHNGTDWDEFAADLKPHSTCLTRDSVQSLDTSAANYFEFDNADWNDGSIGVISSNFAITGVDTGAETFTVAGDQTASFPAGSRFRVKGSTGNDGVWVVASATYTTSTAIVVTGDITDANVDGTIHREGVHIKRAGLYDVTTQWGAVGIDDGEFSRVDLVVNDVLLRLDSRTSAMTSQNDYPAITSTLLLAANDFVESKGVHNEGAAFNSPTDEYNKPRITVCERVRR